MVWYVHPDLPENCILVLRGYGEFTAYMLGKQYGCWSSVAYYSWYLSTPTHDTNVLILMQCEYLSAETADRKSVV